MFKLRALAAVSLVGIIACSSSDSPRADAGLGQDDSAADTTTDHASADVTPDLAPPLDVGPAPIAPQDYCERVTPGYCAFYLRCGLFAATDLAACAAFAETSCNSLYEPIYRALVDASLLDLDPAGVEACLAHLATVECSQQIGDLDGPCAGMWRGKQPAGGACGLGIESFVCAPGSACVLGLDFCGSCRPVVKVGAPCGSAASTEVTCGGAATCREGECVARRKPGETCGGDLPPCVLGARCLGGTCGPAPLAKVGQPCGQAVRCVRAAACVGGTCKATVAIGDSCGADAPCESGRCVGGKCEPRLAPGKPCQVPSDCVSGACTATKTCGSIPGDCF